MGMLVLAAVARAAAATACISIDAKAQGTSIDDVARQIAALRPDYLGLSATTISVTNAARIAERVKAAAARRRHDSRRRARQRHPGAHAGGLPEHRLRHRRRGRGLAVRAARRGSSAARRSTTSPGLAYRRDGRVRRQPARAVHRRSRCAAAAGVGSAAGLPAPLPAVAVQLPAHAGGDADHLARLPVLVHRSAIARPPAARVACTASSTSCGCAAMLVELGVRHIIFVDDLFTVRKQRVVDLCQAFLDARLHLHLELQQPSEPARSRRRCSSCSAPAAGRSPTASSRARSACSTSSSARCAFRACARRCA